MSYNPCSKCKITGVLSRKGNVIFPSIDDEMRSNEEYRERKDEDHFKVGDTPIAILFEDIVAQTPFEYMHLVLLGIVKKTLSAFVIGKYGKKTKLTKHQIDLISNRLNVIVSYCPREFNRKPRSIAEYGNFKATECCQFLLYTGVVVLCGIVEQNAYNHFLLLHAIMRCLSSNLPSEIQLHFSELAIKSYIQLCTIIYDETFLSYNVHGLLHLVKDVRKFGSVDNFSAFPYENNMTFYRNTCRKPNQQLQQIVRRKSEKDKIAKKIINTSIETVIVNKMHSNGPILMISQNNCKQFSKIRYRHLNFTLYKSDNCCILKDGTIFFFVS